MNRRFSHPTYALLAGQGLTAGVAFAINFLSSSVMPPDQRGLLAFFIQVTYVVTTIGLLGVERPYVAERTGTTFPIAIRELDHLTRWIWVGAAILLIGGVAALFGTEWLIALMLIASIAYVASNAEVRKVRIAYIVSGNRRTFVTNIFMVQGGLLALGILLYLLNMDSPAVWLAAYAASSAAAMLTTFRARATGREFKVDGSRLRRVRREGVRLLPASLGNTALLRSDRLMMPFLASPAELGIYVTVATVMEIGAWPVQQWVDASLGRFRAASDSLNRRRLVLKLFFGAIALTALIGLVAYFAIGLLLPIEYQRSQALIPILGAGTVIYALTRLQHGWLIADGRPGVVSVTETVGLIASMALYVGLIPAFGALGAAVASGIGHSILCITTYTLRKRSTRPPREPRPSTD